MEEYLQPSNRLESNNSTHTSTPASVYEDYLQDPKTLELQQKIEMYKRLREKINAEYEVLEANKANISLEEYNTKKKELISWQKDEQDKLSADFGFDINQLSTKKQKSINTAFGFDDESIDETALKYKKYTLEPPEVEGDSATQYLPLMSIIEKSFNGNLKGVTIIEIGPGTAGVKALRFFQSFGAKVIGIDNNSNTQTEDGIVRYGTWNELSKFVDINSADVIFTHHMTPVPELGTPFENNPEGFYRKCYAEMNACLKPGGILLGHNTEADGGIGDPKFYGFDNYTPIKLVDTDSKKAKEKGRINLIIKSK